jgi:hypothetical protein
MSCVSDVPVFQTRHKKISYEESIVQIVICQALCSTCVMCWGNKHMDLFFYEYFS